MMMVETEERASVFKRMSKSPLNRQICQAFFEATNRTIAASEITDKPFVRLIGECGRKAAEAIPPSPAPPVARLDECKAAAAGKWRMVP